MKVCGNILHTVSYRKRNLKICAFLREPKLTLRVLQHKVAMQSETVVLSLSVQTYGAQTLIKMSKTDFGFIFFNSSTVKGCHRRNAVVCGLTASTHFKDFHSGSEYLANFTTQQK